MEGAFYESPTLRRFAGVDLGAAPAPDETTALRFRHLLEKHGLGGERLEAVNAHLEAKGINIQTGTIVDATIIPSDDSPINFVISVASGVEVEDYGGGEEAVDAEEVPAALFEPDA